MKINEDKLAAYLAKEDMRGYVTEDVWDKHDVFELECGGPDDFYYVLTDEGKKRIRELKWKYQEIIERFKVEDDDSFY